MNTRAEALLWLQRWALYHEVRVLFVDLLVEGEPPDGQPEDIDPAKFERCWRIACGRIGLAQATADEMRDTVARNAQLRRAVRLACLRGGLRRQVRAIAKCDPVVDARFARWRAICPTVG